ncbi:MAG: hypothetical protein IT435_12535 [Phycisphaerales bacterium]|nr:hypothetical protein [Phycisphaerales bacterium]
MTGRRLLGLSFVILGLVGVGIGLTTAIGELGGLYKSALEHPLDEPKGGDEKEVPGRMLRSTLTGGIGAVIFGIGIRMARPKRRRR